MTKEITIENSVNFVLKIPLIPSKKLSRRIRMIGAQRQSLLTRGRVAIVRAQSEPLQHAGQIAEVLLEAQLKTVDVGVLSVDELGDRVAGVLGEDGLHQLRLRDPGGHAVTLLEARTYSPAPPGARRQSLCGYFSHLSLPQDDYQAAREFWERAGFVALTEESEPFAHLPLTSDHLDLGFHRRGVFDAPLLVFECADAANNIARLRELGVPLSARLPRGLDRQRSALIESPEGTALLLLQAVD